jgi:hypothetical protein
LAAWSRPPRASKPCRRPAQIVAREVRAFDDFSEDNDPDREHDFGAVPLHRICYDRKTEFGSPDPADPGVTTRVLTIMRADDY